MLTDLILFLDFAKKLLSLARKSDTELMSIFEASFDDSSFNLESFDHNFFIENSKALIEERFRDSDQVV